MADDSQAEHMALDFGMASTTRKGINMDVGRHDVEKRKVSFGWTESE